MTDQSISTKKLAILTKTEEIKEINTHNTQKISYSELNNESETLTKNYIFI